jgi:hypothetical protein
LPQEIDAPIPVVLRDETTLVTGIGAGLNPAARDNTPILVADPNDPHAFVIAWVGSPCDKNVALQFGVRDGRYFLRLSVPQTAGGCPLIGLPRGVRIVTSTVIALDSIELSGSG